MHKLSYLNAGAVCSPVPSPSYAAAARTSVSAPRVMLLTIDSAEPSDAMIDKIKSVVDQSQFVADDSI